jgi:Domain of unknown function (DUF4157)
MFSKIVLAGVIIAAMLGIRSANACDPNESCNRCLASAFGKCIQRGNDPICEVRKKACQVAPPVVNTPGSPFGPGGVLAPGGPLPGLSVNQVQQCVSNLAACPGQILSQIGYQTIKPIIENYIGFLQNQAGNNVQTLDEDFVARVQPFYPINLRNVRYATNINTIHGSNITIGNMIYFTNDIDLNDDDDAALTYHELQHVVQYARKGSVDAFMAQYVLQAGGSVLRGGNSVDIHDNIGLENDAINKATEVANRVAAVSNAQSSPPFQQPGLFPQQPQVGNICRTPIGGCMLPGAGPIGIGCWCGSPNGPVNGNVSPN